MLNAFGSQNSCCSFSIRKQISTLLRTHSAPIPCCRCVGSVTCKCKFACLPNTILSQLENPMARPASNQMRKKPFRSLRGRSYWSLNSRRSRRNGRRRAAHGTNPAPDDTGPQILPSGCAMNHRPSLQVAEVDALALLGAWIFGHYGLSSHALRKDAHYGRGEQTETSPLRCS